MSRSTAVVALAAPLLCAAPLAVPANAAPAPAAAKPAAVAPAVTVPSGVTAGVAVFDRTTGSFTEQLNPDLQFRSASVVKLLIALDYLWNLGPSYSVPDADAPKLNLMLRSSDDGYAQEFWDRGGQGAIIDRMVPRLGLTDTARPPAAYPDYWGYSALSAADTVKIYRYILDSAPSQVRDFVMGDLRQSTRCGTDGFDQRFGIPSAFTSPWAVKQGWSGFGSTSNCTEGTASSTAAAHSRALSAKDVDLSQVALHTTGTVGAGDRSIVAVFTLQPAGTAFGKAYSNLGTLVRSLNVPGGTHPSGSWFGTWGTGPNVRASSTTASGVLTVLPAGVDALVSCQAQGQTVTADGYTNNWWAYLPLYGGYITNIYLKSPGDQLPGVPTC